MNVYAKLLSARCDVYEPSFFDLKTDNEREAFDQLIKADPCITVFDEKQ